MVRTIQKLMAPLHRRLLLMVGRGVLRLVNDALKMQEVQIAGLADEVRDGVEHFQPYGFTAHAQSGAEALYLRLGGSSAHTVVIAVADRRYRLTALEAGEVALHDDQGQKVHLKRACIEIVAPVQVNMVTPLLAVTGSITCANLTAVTTVADASGTKTMAGMRSVYNSHTHATSPAPSQAM